MKSARIYDFTLTAGGSFTMNVEGDYVRIMSSTGAVEILTDAMRIGPIKAGQGQSDTPYKRITINDKSGAGNVGTILVASSGFIDQRISGEVSVIDGGKSRSIAGGAFATYFGLTPVAGQYSRVQLFNPLASGKNVIVKAYKVSVPASTTCFIHLYNGQLAASNALVNSKFPTGLNPSAIACYENGVSILAVTRPIDYLNFIGISTNSFLFQEPVVIPPGWGFIVENALQNNRIDASFEWIEELI